MAAITTCTICGGECWAPPDDIVAICGICHRKNPERCCCTPSVGAGPDPECVWHGDPGTLAAAGKYKIGDEP